jgi:uncharacterized protein
MGHSHSSTERGGNGGFLAANCGIAEAASESGGSVKKTPSVGAWILLVGVRAYQVMLAPFLGGACKFSPSCSQYAFEAVRLHGARLGTWLALRRLARCRPFTSGGFDPVPEPFHEPARELADEIEEKL